MRRYANSWFRTVFRVIEIKDVRHNLELSFQKKVLSHHCRHTCSDLVRNEGRNADYDAIQSRVGRNWDAEVDNCATVIAHIGYVVRREENCVFPV